MALKDTSKDKSGKVFPHLKWGRPSSRVVGSLLNKFYQAVENYSKEHLAQTEKAQEKFYEDKIASLEKDNQKLRIELTELKESFIVSESRCSKRASDP